MFMRVDLHAWFSAPRMRSSQFSGKGGSVDHHHHLPHLGDHHHSKVLAGWLDANLVVPRDAAAYAQHAVTETE
jgi:hypothetical protein